MDAFLFFLIGRCAEEIIERAEERVALLLFLFLCVKICRDGKRGESAGTFVIASYVILCTDYGVIPLAVQGRNGLSAAVALVSFPHLAAFYLQVLVVHLDVADGFHGVKVDGHYCAVVGIDVAFVRSHHFGEKLLAGLGLKEQGGEQQ